MCFSLADGYLEVVTEGRDAAGGEVARAGVLALLPDSPTGALQLDMDGSTEAAAPSAGWR